MGRTILITLRRMYLYPFLFLYNINRKEDITVIEAVKDIPDQERMINNLESIRRQDYDQDLVHITLVDYDSDVKLIPHYQEMCRKYNAKYIRVDNKPIWNRAHALNIAIKSAKTKYILSTDIDNIFESNYIKEAVRELKRDPLQVIISALLDLPDIPTSWKEYPQLKPLAKIRCENMELSAGTNLALTYFYRKIRGYDEKYKLWGAEDADLIKRFKCFALKIKSIDKVTSYLHQYHPRYRNLKEIDGFEKQVVKNRVYFANSASIVRNAGGWGNPRLSMGDVSTEKTRLLKPSVCLLPAILLYRLIKREDITVIMPIKNIDGKYLINCLKSIREQVYGQSLIDIMLIDYNSGAEFALLYKRICAQYRARYIRIDNRPVWHKTNAFNIGIKMTKTKYILTADVDMIFEKNYIWEAVKELKRDPFQVIVNAALDLPDIPIEDKNYDELKLLATPRYNLKYMNGITLTFTCFYHKLRGYDEEYKVWGSEDDDLIKRFKLFGLAPKPINDRTSYLHQYHERYRGVKDIKRLKDIIALNRYYFNSTNSIVRNRKGWGE